MDRLEFESRHVADPLSGCWLWTGMLTTSGYGGYTDNGKVRVASRLSWELHEGPIPPGLCVLHRCDVRPCVNPAHLFLGTKGDNNRDCAAKGRYPEQQRTHCPRGHPYDQVNTYRHGGQRFCRACPRERRRAASKAER